jgi:hypothetical protein
MNTDISRRLVLAAAGVALAACRARTDNAALLPETVGPWQRSTLRELPAASAGEPPARGSIRSVFRAEYGGPAKAEVTVYDLSSSAAALDAVQRFRPAPDTIFFHRDSCFVVMKWQGSPDRKTLGEFVRAIEKSTATGR